MSVPVDADRRPAQKGASRKNADDGYLSLVPVREGTRRSTREGWPTRFDATGAPAMTSSDVFQPESRLGDRNREALGVRGLSTGILRPADVVGGVDALHRQSPRRGF